MTRPIPAAEHPHCRAILAFVRAYQVEHQRSPSYREIGAAIGIPSTDHIKRDLGRLERAGLVKRARFVRRRNLLLLEPLPPAPTAPAPETFKRAGYCNRCWIESATPVCGECATKAPLIQTHLHMGNDRFCVNHSTFVGAPAQEDTERASYRRRKQTKAAQPAVPAPRARVNADGVKLCGRCDEPRHHGDAYCPAHRREIQLAYYYRHHAKRKAAQNTDTQRQRVRVRYHDKKRSTQPQAVSQ